MPPRNYTRGDRAALAVLSHGVCYWPGCSEPLLEKVGNRFKLRLQIAHIRTDEENHERYVPGLTNAELDGFENLLFLCKPHHEVVDESGAEEYFTIEKLTKLKEQHEQGRYESLRGLRDLTEDRLAKMISEAQRQRDEEFKVVVDRLERSDQQAAALLRELRIELASVTSTRYAVDPDVAFQLDRAARLLVNLPDYASMLASAAQKLIGLEDKAILIRSAAESVNRAAARLEDVNGMR